MADFVNNNVGMDWTDTIESDGQEFVLLPEGDYNFVVSAFERGRFPGSAKMQACNKATLTLQVETKQGVASVRTAAPIRGFSARGARGLCDSHAARGVCTHDARTASAPVAADGAPDDAVRAAPVCDAPRGVPAVCDDSVHSALFGDIASASTAVASASGASGASGAAVAASGAAVDRPGGASTNLAEGASAVPSPQGAARELSGPGAPIGRAGP